MKNKIIAIHQPNFFPWLGFFDKIIRSDVFILLDHVQYPKKGGTWTNRVKLCVAGEAKWITAPIIRHYHGVKAINQMSFQPGKGWREKILKTIICNYKKAPFYSETIELIESLILNKENNISIYNQNAIFAISEKLGIDKNKFCLSSKVHSSGSSNELLISLIKGMKGTSYLCGGGADKYQENWKFQKNNIEVIFQNFQHPQYRKNSPNGLSVLDSIFYIGFSGVREILKLRNSNELSKL